VTALRFDHTTGGTPPLPPPASSGANPLTDHDALAPYLLLIRTRLSDARVRHSIGVMQVMADLARIYSLDRAQAMTAGLLHDAARNVSDGDLLAFAGHVGIELRHPCERHPIYLHALVGAHQVERQLGVTDPAIVAAIAAHSYVGDGREFDAPLSRCLRIADLLAPMRLWPGLDKLQHVAYAGRLEEASLLHAAWVIELFQEQEVPVHPNLSAERDVLAAKLAVPASFFDRE
jgi:predicted HD superfamily hydrolase involved in NAD metabolism